MAIIRHDIDVVRGAALREESPRVLRSARSEHGAHGGHGGPRYVFDERLAVYLPLEMEETHHMQDGATLRSVARYGRVRAFAVETTEGVR